MNGVYDCELVPKPRLVPGECDACPTKLPPRRRRWCSDKCAGLFYRIFSTNHDWGSASDAAKKRDGYKCVRCGATETPPQGEVERLGSRPTERVEYHAWLKSKDALWRRFQLEVNHVVPRNGAGYGRGCHHHLSNLETLCHPCHVKVTNEQRAARGC